MSMASRKEIFKKQYEGLDEREAELFVGKNSRYYLDNWRSYRDGSKTWGINWPAFIFSIFWLGYRKMYSTIFYIMGFFVLVDVIQFFINIDISRNVGIAIGACVGGTGNTMYYKYMNKKIDKIKEENNDSLKIETEIVRAGNASWGGVGISLLMLLGYVIVSMIIEGILTSF